MPNAEMGDQLPSSCFTRILRVRYAPPDVYGPAKVLAIGFEVLGLEVSELAEEGHGRWLYCPIKSYALFVRKLSQWDRLLQNATVRVEERELSLRFLYAGGERWRDRDTGNITLLHFSILKPCASFVLLKRSW
jgi:hypothetical protein